MIKKRGIQIFQKFSKQEFTKYLEGELLSFKTIILYIKVIKVIRRKLNGYSKEEIKEFLKKHPRKYYRSALKYYLEYMGKHIKLPTKIKEPPRDESKIKNINRLDLKATLEKIEPKLQPQEKLIIEILYWTGKRISEVLKIKKRDVDFENKEIIFYTKGGLIKKVPITDELFLKIKKYYKDKELLASDDLFYPTRWGKGDKTHTKYMIFRNRINKLDKEFIPILNRTHNFRRAIINYIALKKGVEYANAFIGHANMNTTMVYVSEQTKQKFIETAFKVIQK